jgi:hypothetical protein
MKKKRPWRARFRLAMVILFGTMNEGGYCMFHFSKKEQIDIINGEGFEIDFYYNGVDQRVIDRIKLQIEKNNEN